MQVNEVLNMVNVVSKGYCFLVGGSVRDLLLGRAPRDIDLVVYGRARDLVCKLVGVNGIRTVVLNKEHDLVRVVLLSNMYHVDITGLGSEELPLDLRRRDFTINAMALPVKDYLQGDWSGLVIDPLGGLSDLREGVIRACSTASFNKDPIRVLRAVRLQAQLGFNIAPGTMELMQNLQRPLSTAPGERVWEEFRLILDLPNASDIIDVLAQRIKALEQIFPEIELMRRMEQNYYHTDNVWDHCFKTLVEFERLTRDESLRVGENYWRGEKRLPVIKLACLFHDVGKLKTSGMREDGRITFYGHHQAGGPMAENIGHRLKMSKREIQLFRRLVEWHMQPLFLYKNNPPSSKSVFRFFRHLGQDTPACLLLSLADVTSSRRATGKLALAEEYKKYILHLLRQYKEKKDQVFNHKTLLDGKEICSIFGLKPCPLVGRLKNDLWDAQMEGKVTTRQEALEFLHSKIKR
ncbi:CCA tRNA nucleotidyltransferase [Desulfallas thermosapovorans]|uniref:Poly(A) polymerase n=1 Tax=Desulfallas thermosapovorans DSM 6562 TaxID=1121431 RepID=A0A5S5A0D5_9FIRM|nr:HDIG domain-containing metalloprotein [Desulfallas thermosapovorans]TYO97950.1 poly(A) polymerase [Desulfallas thermosapovorans DSM 6562]